MIATVRKCTLYEVTENANFPALAREYSAEAALAELPPPDEKLACYEMLDGSSAFSVFGAFMSEGVGEKLIGFVAVILPVVPHYGVAVAVTESLFVGQAYRKTGAGLKLLRAAEALAREAGSPALMVSAPHGGRLAYVLWQNKAYRPSNLVFIRSFSHG